MAEGSAAPKTTREAMRNGYNAFRRALPWMIGADALAVGAIWLSSGIPPSATMMALVGLGGFLLASTYALWHRVGRRWGAFLWNLLLAYILVPAVLAAAVATVPYTMHTHILSNGTRTVVFQEMIHIARPGFYTELMAELRRLHAEGYVLYYEGVEVSSPEELAALSGVINEPPSLRPAVAAWAQLAIQDNAPFLDAAGGGRNVDVTAAELIRLFRERHPDHEKASDTAELEENLAALKTRHDTLGPNTQDIAGVVARAAMRLAFHAGDVAPEALAGSTGAAFLEIVIDERNKVVATAILASKEDKVVVLYGARHYEGVLALLRAHDPAWHEVGTISRRAL